MSLIEIDQNLCKGCTLCSQVCGIKACSGEPLIPHNIDENRCVNCGQCIVTCPTGAVKVKSDVERVKAVLKDKSILKVIQAAPAVRFTLGEGFDMEPGSIVPGQMASAFRQLGFDRVYDTCFAADLTIMEEGTELITRLKSGGRIPMFTSCCPAWVLFLEKNYPELLDHLSSCKSPQQMFGTLVKTYMAEREDIDPSKIFLVSAMPCTAKKYEAERLELKTNGIPDVDAVLTTRELIELIQSENMDIGQLPEEHFDIPFGDYTGAGVIFGASGGVMEAALRTAVKIITGKKLRSLTFAQIRGRENFREASIEVSGIKLKVAIAHGLNNIVPILEDIKKGECDYHFIEVMNCPDGCIGGGGQPCIPKKSVRKQILDKRNKATYYYELGLPKRESDENPSIKAIYREYLTEPLSKKAHELLHTTYFDKSSD